MRTVRARLSDTVKEIPSNCGRSQIVIFCLALALRLAVAVWLPADVVWPDGYRYMRVADNLLNAHGFGSLYDNQLSVPTQPLVIAAVKLVFGQSYLALRVFFCVLGAGTCVIAYALVRRLFSPIGALIAGLLLAVYPLYVYASALFEYPQTLYVFMVALAFVLLYDVLNTFRYARLFVCGLLFGLAILTVPTTLLFVPLLLLLLRSPRLADWLIRGVIVLAGISIPVGAWTARNAVAYGQFILVNEASGTNFWAANNETYYLYGKTGVVPPCASGYEQTQYCSQNRALDRDLRAENLTATNYIIAHEKASWDHGLKFVRDNPATFAQLTVRKFLQFWSPDPDAVTRGQVGTFRLWLARLSYVPVLVVGVLGMTLAFIRCRSRMLPILYFMMAFSLPYYVFMPTTRYRLPMDLFLIIFTAAVSGGYRPSSSVASLPRNNRETSIRVQPN